jgi:hypothetical protein
MDKLVKNAKCGTRNNPIIGQFLKPFLEIHFQIILLIGRRMGVSLYKYSRDECLSTVVGRGC